MKLGYTIHLAKKDEYLSFDTVQFTVSKYHLAHARNTLGKFRNWGSTEQKVLVHLDFYSTLPRFIFMAAAYQNSMVYEIHSAIYASHPGFRKEYGFPNVLGCIVHTDTPFSQAAVADLWENGIPKDGRSLLEFILKYWTSNLYRDPEELVDVLMPCFAISDTIDDLHRNIYYTSASHLLQRLNKFNNGDIFQDTYKGHIFLENTVRVYDRSKRFDTFGKLDSLIELVNLSELFGICIDEEHAFAAGDHTLIDYDKGLVRPRWEFIPKDYVEDSRVLVHLNTIPKEVTYNSFLDRHSFTTLFESKGISSDVYQSLMTMLEAYHIPYVREVKEETIVRELKQLRYGIHD